ncbi:response regulator transcription factor [Poseidonibacter parvus]|uniref:response regulator transcription factor n=1 Tax=Poseidonibacter parvus TaxID=1850254 RepID=UPI00155FEBB4|nr:response regulator [Poseidonibacter parvus]
MKKLLKQLTILYVSKKDSNYKKINTTLEIFFDNIIRCNNKEDALFIYKDTFPNIIIVDIDLVDSNGIELIKDIRKKNKNIPILIITNNIETHNLIEAIKLNLIDYLLKPIDVSKLIFSLNKIAKIILNSGEISTFIKKDIKYNYLEKTILHNNKTEVLTKTESRLLELLLTNKNKIVSIKEIKKVIWSDKEVSESAFKSLLNRLSKKIGKDTISNSFGIGYGLINK